MPEKKTILHFIYNLGRGGAETLMVRVIEELKEYNNIVVTLYDENHFETELKCDKYFCLNMGPLPMFPLAAVKLRKIIKENKVDIVHTHLFWPMIIARMATPKRIPLISTIHAFIKSSVEYKFWRIRFLDKTTYKLRKSIILADAKGALDEYFDFLKKKPYKAYPLHTLVDTSRFDQSQIPAFTKDESVFKMVAVGALRLQKNYPYLIKAMELLKDEPFELHIYGMGPLQQELQQSIDKSGVKVILKGEVKNIQQLIPQYDLFVMTSTFEGFSLSVLEAMAMRMPLLLSDIASFREQCEDIVDYFDLNNTADFADKLRKLAADKSRLQQMAAAVYERVVNNFTLEHHMKKQRNIYMEALMSR